ncbi:nuclear RNA export factor 2-like isoform X1 [Peromyscus californicus insignis]|uniref:nuclear RNA export factor 2-like isoform X1 n=1 Tax=Peromyscus californicus insignis TaxID=564181 RepID=UPI0022A77BD5|nr:nuclear RNA export factor 2-like isoform X1 [Peromyscus californicus insignis]XP_052591813.1 nuclear RNA export factor 2-like isoform X1 [Peromyscus californicus insignis]XP_052591821.1 nuclear RNA export factor 2-like isoform X1 [Peromyscus californicus insignis]XP_052591827.1 nuclear RNA export factor 2-like isoform X1 [Peromyscus californicus insignis]XP_052591833.1 nuclear RNA export factor 2-like isoform X1 [Peromyscus californicus insignis]
MDDNRVFRGRKKNLSYNRHTFDRKNHHFEHYGVPYSMGPKWRRRKYSDEDQIFLTVWDDDKPEESEIGLDAENGTLSSWFKVTIPNGRKYEKTWLINSMQDLCNVPFIPVDFHYDKHRARFFVQDPTAAYALKDISHKICDETSQKIPIFVSPSVVPYSVRNKFTSEQMDRLKVTVMKRYDASQKALDLQKFRFDQDLMNSDIDMMLNRRSCMVATLQIIQSNIPELLALNLCNNKLYQLDGLSDVVEKAPQVKILNLSKNKLKSVWELEKVKELNLEELWLEGNPFCNHFMDQSDYISAIRDLFPKLLRLDGKELLISTGMDIEVPQLSKETCTESELIKNLVLQFLKEYYLFYDNGDRLRLIDAYHDEACFSLAVPFNFSDPNLSNLEEYFKHNRDIKKLQDSYMRMRLLKHTKRDIVDSLSLLPKTQHDLCSFWVDVCCHTDMMLCFSVNGLFKEVEGKCQGCVRAFTRIFIATHYSNSRICIMNDELIVRNASPKEIQNAFISLPTANASSKSPLSEEQQEMVKSFSMQSKMKLNWSQKCLEDNGWDYNKAAEIFTVLQNEGKIPKDFFE